MTFYRDIERCRSTRGWIDGTLSPVETNNSPTHSPAWRTCRLWTIRRIRTAGIGDGGPQISAHARDGWRRAAILVTAGLYYFTRGSSGNRPDLLLHTVKSGTST